MSIRTTYRATILLMLGRDAFSARFPWDTLRSAWLGSPVAAHRPELAERVASADLDLEDPGIWLCPRAHGLSSDWFEEKRFAVAVASGWPMEWIRILPETGRGREA